MGGKARLRRVDGHSTAETGAKTFNLPEGDYTIVFGSNAPAHDPNRQGFKATLSTAPMIQPVALKNGPVPGWAGVTFTALGSPTINDEENVAFLAVLAGPGVTAANDTAILADHGGEPLRVVVREGDTDPKTGGVFTAFGDPITDNGDNVLFFGKLKPKAEVTKDHDTGLWRYEAASETLQSVVQEGEAAPGATDGATFKSFPSVVADLAGGAFVAKLTLRGRITEANDTGAWLFHESGFMTLLAREGKLFTVGPGDVRIVKTLHFLEPMPRARGVRRSTNAFGGRVLSLTFKDGTSGIFHIAP